jgi:UDP-N-acetylmuramoyl-tripeptide--D-alanyl-D-alanine ligase
MTISLGWTAMSIADQLGGALIESASAPVAAMTVSRVSIDSRELEAGDLFVAIRGEQFDGHTFAGDALAAGATVVVVEKGRSDVVPRIEVVNTSTALRDLASRRRSELTMPVVAITGSTGKTTTKDLIHAGIEGSWASPRSYNNEVGVPLTVLGTPQEATALVLEVGSRGKGHIRWLGDVIRPDVSVVTNLGVVHLATFGSTSGLADAKYEIVELLGSDGVAVLPVDESRLHRSDDVARVTFGSSSAADVWHRDLTMDEDGRPSFTIETGSASFPVSLSVAGAHQAANAAAATAAALALGLEPEPFIRRMEAATGSDWRMEVHRGRVTVVNDAYNANPQSMASALTTVAGMGGRSIAVIGVMAELGSVCQTEHRRMGQLAEELGFSTVIVVGEDHGYAVGAPGLVVQTAGFEDAMRTLDDTVQPGDVVLVKASRSAGLEQLAAKLIKEYTL